jgi:hypothetical protein
MKLPRTTVRWATLAAAAVAFTAAAQPEQWLQYHTSSEGRGYRWLETTTNAPPNVALPKLGSQPYFVRWVTPLDPAGGRWLCFDRSRKSGPWNRLYADRTGAGRLDSEKPIDSTRTDQYSAYFDSVRFVFKGEDGPLTYHLNVRFLKYDDGEVRLLVSPGCFYEGKVMIGGKRRTVTLVDGNVNGVFNDIDPNPSDCDRIVVEGDKAGDRYLGRLLEVDNQFFQMEAARDGAFLKIKKAANVTLGQVRVGETISEFTAVGDAGHFIRKPEKGEFTLPLGKYRVQGWAVQRKDEKGANWRMSGSGFGESASFEVAAAKTATPEVGEPLRPSLTVQENKTGATYSLRLKGRLGESVDIEKDNQRPRPPRLLLASSGGSFRATNSFEWG